MRRVSYIFQRRGHHRRLRPFPTRRSSDLSARVRRARRRRDDVPGVQGARPRVAPEESAAPGKGKVMRHVFPRTIRLAAVAAAVIAGAAGAAATRAGAQQTQNFDAVQLDIQQVSGNVYMVVGAGGNTTVLTGPEGVMVVDTQFAPLSGKILDAIRKLSDQPIRWIVNTHMHGDHTGGNEANAKAGRTRAGGNVVGDIGAAATDTAGVIAHENVLKRLSAPPAAGQEIGRAACRERV